MTELVASLSEDGWVRSPQQVGDYIFSHFYLAEKSQSYMYAGSIASLPALVQKYNDDTNGLQIETQRVLSSYFGRYFGPNNVTVETSVDPETPDSSRYTLSIYVSFSDANGQVYNLGKLVNVMNTKIAKVIDANDNGPAHA